MIRPEVFTGEGDEQDLADERARDKFNICLKEIKGVTVQHMAVSTNATVYNDNSDWWHTCTIAVVLDIPESETEHEN